MGVTIPVGYGQATIRYRYTGATRDSVVTFGYDPPTTDPEGNAFLFHSELTLAARPCIASALGTNWTYLGVKCVEVVDTGPLTGEFLANVTGSAGATTLPPNCSVLIRKITAAGGRRNRGRLYVPPVYPLESQVGPDGVLDPGLRTTLQLWWNNFYEACTTAGLPWRLFHDAAPFTPTIVSAISVEARLATQRRRLRK